MATDSVSEAYSTFNKAIDRVLKNPPGPKRWRAAHDLWLSLHSDHRRQYNETVKDCRTLREGLTNKYGLGKEKNLRNYLSLPQGAYYAIVRSDPYAFKKKENAKKMFNEFKEYRTAEVY